MTEENITEATCPHCGKIIKVIGCRTCKYRHRNFEIYEEAKECWECNMLHKNYEREENKDDG